MPAAIAQLLDRAGFTEGPASAGTEQLDAMDQSCREFLKDLARDVPGLDAVLAAVPIDMPPVAVAGFLDTPHPDLTMAKQLLNPVQWLQRGGDVAEVLRLLETADWYSR